MRDKKRVLPIVDFSKRGDVSRFEFKSQPETLQAQRRALWSVKVLWRVVPENGREYIRDLDFINEHILHLYVVSQDRKFFAHLLPEPRDYGHFLVETALPRAGNYQLIAEYVPHKSLPELKRKTIQVLPAQDGAEISAPPAAPLLSATQKEIESAATRTPLDVAGNPRLSGDGLESAPPSTFTISLQAETPLVAGDDVKFHATVKNAGGQAPPLQLYLGGAGFFSALSRDGQSFVRAAAELETSSPREYSQDAAKSGAPFTMRFPRAGRYTLWCEFGLERATLSAPFEIEVRAASTRATQEKSAKAQPAAFSNRRSATR